MDIKYGPSAEWVCMDKDIRPRGIFYGDSPLNFATPVLLIQLSLSSLVYGILQYFLAPFGQTTFISQMLGGILIGPLALGRHISFLQKIFPAKSFYMAQTLAFFGCIPFLFLIGVRMDISMVRKSGKKAVMIGLSTFFVPLIFTTIFTTILSHFVTADPDFRKSLVSVAGLQCMSSFYVIACVLADLKLLNSELGRLAISSSMITGMCSWALVVIFFAATLTLRSSSNEHKISGLWTSLSIVCLLVLIICILRPILLWMVRHTTEGKSIKESYTIAIFLMILVCSLLGDITGQNFLFGPMILGIVVPDGPPIGSALVERLDSFVSCVLMPIFFVMTAAKLNIATLTLSRVGFLESLILFSFMAKLMGTMLPSIYCKMPVLDALSLALILSSQGITDVLLLMNALRIHLIDEQTYSIMMISIVVFNGITTPIVKALYKPSERYISYKRRTIQHSRPEEEVRLLTCIYHQENTPSIINLLQVSNPTLESPICVYLVHLIELAGRSSSVLVAHRLEKKNSSHGQFSERIINAFRLYGQQNPSILNVNPFTAISPFVTMHEDVCSLAQDKRVSMVIVPFHKQFWTVHGSEESTNSIRAVNRNILRKAPCSVGILIDRGTLRPNIKPAMPKGKPLYNIGTIFLGGQDDREALAYTARMSKHPDASVTVVRFLESNNGRSKYNSTDSKLDFDYISDFRLAIKGNKRHFYKEEVVKDSVEMISVIRSFENSFDLILVGRRHTRTSPLFVGLTEWNEYPELGFVGDMLVSTDSSCRVSVLVVQQQTFAGDQEMLESPKFVAQESDMPWESLK